MGGSLPFRSGVVVSLRPLCLSGLLVAGTSAFPWLVTVLTSTHLLLASSADSPGALGVLPSFPMVVRTLAVGPGFFFCFLPALRPPSGFGYTGSIGFSSPIEFPTFAMGSPLRSRGLSVLDRNDGLVSPLRSGTLVRSWLDLPPLSVGICAPGPQGVLPGGAPLTVGMLPSSPTLLCPLSSGCPVGW